jgi:hypothetical protein
VRRLRATFEVLDERAKTIANTFESIRHKLKADLANTQSTIM